MTIDLAMCLAAALCVVGVALILRAWQMNQRMEEHDADLVPIIYGVLALIGAAVTAAYAGFKWLFGSLA